jgi:hypothetical protein
MGILLSLIPRLWTTLAAGAGFGFVARDLLTLPAAGVALAWLGGALLGFFGLEES